MIELIFIASLFSLALYNFSQEDEPLEFIREWFDIVGMKKVQGNYNIILEERKIFYPVMYCAICMGWFYFTVIFAVFNTFVDTWQLIDIFWWVTCAPATSFLNWYLQETLAKALN